MPSVYSHDLHKFADAGLQLRTPVDLVPAMQYSRLTNALPVIEGQMQTRDGLVLVNNIYNVAAVATLGRPNTISANATIATTIYPHGFVVGQSVSINVFGLDPTSGDIPSGGVFSVLVTAVPNVNTFQFTPSIPVAWAGSDTSTLVYANATSDGTQTTLSNRTITNIFRLNQALPSIPTSQFIVMSGRTYRASLDTSNIRSVAVGITNIQITSNILIVTMTVPNPYAAGTVVQLTGLSSATFLNNQNVLSAPYTPGTSNQFFAPFTHADYGPAPDTGTVTGMVAELPAFGEIVLPSLAGIPPSVASGFSSHPLSLVSFRFTDDPASWLIIGDSNQMAKYRENETGFYFFRLGNPFPTVQAEATAGGAGNLNSSGGTGYDWRYTWHDGIVNTEGNPSPITVGVAGGVVRPTTFTTPFGGGYGAVTNPANAVDGSSSTPTTISAFAEDFGGGPHTPPPVRQVQSVLYSGAASGGGSIVLTADYAVTFDSEGTTHGVANVIGSWSTDGTNFTTFVNVSNNVSRKTTSVTLPAGTDSSTVSVKFISTAAAGGNSSVTIQMNLFDLSMTTDTSTTVQTLSLTNQSANVCVTAPGNLNDGRVQNIRLYRRGGSLVDGWRLVGTFPISSLSQGSCGAGYLLINDNISDTELSSAPLLELDNDQPVTSITTLDQPLNAIWGPVGSEARLMGCGDPNRPEVVYWSKPGNPDAWPPENFAEVSEPGTPIISGTPYNNRIYAFSRERVYELVEGITPGVTFTPFVTPSAHGLFTKTGLAIGPAMFFISKDGIYASTGGQEQSIVENDIKPLFPTYDTPGQDVGLYEAVDYTQPDAMRLRYHNDELYFTYAGATSGILQMLIYDLLKKRWRAADYSVGISEVYSQPSTVSSLLIGSSGGSYYEAGGPIDPFEMEVLEGVHVGTSSPATITLPAGPYYIKVTKFTNRGELAVSNELGPVTVTATTGLAVALPEPGPTTDISAVKWRVYFGVNPGGENQYAEVPESLVATFSGRVFSVLAPGTPGSPPEQNPAFEIAVIVITGANDQGAPLNQKQLGNVILDANPGGGVISLTPLINGAEIPEAPHFAVGTQRDQFPFDLSDFYAFNTEYQLGWVRSVLSDGTVADPVLFQYDTLHFLEPAQVTHWETQSGSSFGFPGYIHCRDAYITLRSTADCTFTMMIDGDPFQTYLIPSTGNQQQKVYIPFDSNKGLLYNFSLDCVGGEFRVYNEELEVRVKPWLGLLGYSIQRVIGAETNA